MDAGRGPRGEASGPVALVGVPRGLGHQLHSESVPAGWVDLGFPHHGAWLLFRVFKANRVRFSHLAPLTTHLCQNTNIDLPGGELLDVGGDCGPRSPRGCTWAGWVLRTPQLIPASGSPWPDPAPRGSLFPWPLAWFFPPLSLVWEEDMSLCKRVGPAWGWRCREVYLHLDGRKWRCVWPIPFGPCLLSRCPLTISSGGELKGTLGIRKRVRSLLCACIRPDLPFG